jgi:hypothetical protein
MTLQRAGKGVCVKSVGGFLIVVLAAAAASAMSQGAPVRLHIALAFDRGAAPSFERAVAEEAGRVWAAYGIHVDGSPADARRRSAPITLEVSMVQRPAPGTNTETLGSIVFHDGTAEPRISLYVATAADLLSTATHADPSHWPVAFHDELLTRVLGRALAHEIGHYVLNTREHSRSGLMRAVHPIAELMEFRGGDLALAPDNREALCEVLSQAPDRDRT